MTVRLKNKKMTVSFFDWIWWKLRLVSEQNLLFKIRDYDINQAEKFYQENRSNLETLSYVMYHDENFEKPFVRKGQLISDNTYLGRVRGTSATFTDFPCLYYKMKTGEDGFLFCYMEWKTNKSFTRVKGSWNKKKVFKKVPNKAVA